MMDNIYGVTTKTTEMRSWVLWQMLRGMGWAALGVFAVGMTLLVIWGVSLLLPAESKQAPSPYTLDHPRMPAVIQTA